MCVHMIPSHIIYRSIQTSTIDVDFLSMAKLVALCLQICRAISTFDLHVTVGEMTHRNSRSRSKWMFDKSFSIEKRTTDRTCCYDEKRRRRRWRLMYTMRVDLLNDGKFMLFAAHVYTRQNKCSSRATLRMKA
jgi:hypothetical protein